MNKGMQAMRRLLSRRMAESAVLLMPVLVAPATAAVTWDGGSSVNASWQTLTNWVGDVLPTFNNTLDVNFYAAGTVNRTTFMGTSSTIKSLNFTADADLNISIRLTSTASSTTARHLSFGGAGGAAITSVAGAAGNFTLGVAGGNVILLENLTISHNGSGTLTINRPITGTGFSLTRSGTGGVVTLSATNTYSGYTTIAQGTLSLGAGGMISNSPVITVASGAVFVVPSTGFTLGSARALQGSGSISGNVTASSGSGIIPGDNGTVGTLTFNNGLNLSEASALAFDLSSSPLSGNDQIVVSGSVTNSGNTVVALKGLSSGILGAGTYTLMTYASRGGSGTFVLDQPYANVTLNVNQTNLTLTVGTGGGVTSKAWIGGNGNAWDIATSMNWTYSGSVAAAVYNDGEAVTFDDSTTNLTMNLGVTVAPAHVTVNAVQSYMMTGPGKIGGSASLTKHGTGELTLSTTNSYSGGTVLNLGTLNVNTAEALGTGTFTVNGGTVNNTSGAAVTVTNSLVINGDFSTDNNQVSEQLIFSSADIALGTAAGSSRTITATAAGTSGLTLVGRIANGASANSIVKLGPGGIVLSGDSTFSGGVTLSEGVLGVNSSSTSAAGPLGAGTLTIGDNTVLTTGGTTARTVSNAVSVLGNVQLGSNTGNGALTLAGAINLNGGTRAIDIYNTAGDTLSGQISNGALTVGSTGNGILTLSGNNTYAGDTVMMNTARLQVGSDANLGVGTNVILNQNSVLTISGSFATRKSFTMGVIEGNAMNPKFSVLAGNTLMLNGPVSGVSPYIMRDGGGTLVMASSNYFNTGSVFLQLAGTLCVSNAYALNRTTLKYNGGDFLDNCSGTPLTLAGFEGLEMTGGFSFIGSDDLDLSAMPAAFVQTANNIRTIAVSNNTLMIGGILSTGTNFAGNARVAGGLNKTGIGTLVIKGASDYTNGTRVTAGTLRLAANDALPPGGAVTLAGGKLDMGAFTSTPSSLLVTTNSTLVAGAGHLTFTNQTADAWSANLSITNGLGSYTLRFWPATLTPDQLSHINFEGKAVYLTSDGYVRSIRGTLISVY